MQARKLSHWRTVGIWSKEMTLTREWSTSGQTCVLAGLGSWSHMLTRGGGGIQSGTGKVGQVGEAIRHRKEKKKKHGKSLGWATKAYGIF